MMLVQYSAAGPDLPAGTGYSERAPREPTPLLGAEMLTRCLFAALAPLVIASCVGDSGPLPPEFGSISVTTITTGTEPDPDGYSFRVNQTPEWTIGSNASLTLLNLTPALHVVELSGVASNCVVSEGATRTVSVEANATAAVSYAITCGGPPEHEPPTAGFTITAESGESMTEGGQLDLVVEESGFIQFSLDGSRTQPGAGSTITAYEWQNNGITVSTEAAFSLELDEGTFVISLRVTNSAGLSHTAIATIDITE